MDPKTKRTLIYCFFFSGAMGLVAQVVWTRQLTMTLGSTTYAVSTVLAVFMGGLALGALLFGRWAHRLKKPVFVYGVMEGIIAGYLLATPWLLKLVDGIFRYFFQQLGPQEGALLPVRILASAVFLLGPTLLMGGTLPVLLAAFPLEGKSGAKLTGQLYGINTLGAVAGAFGAGFLFIPRLGMKGSLSLASLAGAAILLTMVLLSRRLASEQTEVLNPNAKMGIGSTKGVKGILAIFALTGFCALALEVMWTRILVLHFGSAVYAFSLMLTLFLLGLGGGALVGARWAQKTEQPARTLSWVMALLAGFLPLQMALFFYFSDILVSLAEIIRPNSYGSHTLVLFLSSLPVLIPPTFLMGVTFPLGIRLLEKERLEAGSLSALTGRLYGFNTLGTVFGALAAGFFLIPWIGVQNSLILVAGLQVAAGVFFVLRVSQGGFRMYVPLGLAAIGVVACFAFPARGLLLSAGIFTPDANMNTRIIFHDEDADATVTVEVVQLAKGAPYGTVSLNGVNVAGSSRDLFAIQKLQGHLPLTFVPDAKDVLHIGFGSGGTAKAVSRHPVERIDIAELTRSVPEASMRFFSDINQGVLEDPRVNLIYCDGRNFVLATDQTYDLILSDSIHPRYAGNGSLYTQDYFKLCKQRLNDGGVLSMWLPFYSLREQDFKSILQAFYQEFPNSYLFYVNSTINAYTIVLGRKGEGPWDLAAAAASLERPEVKADLEPILAAQVNPLLDYLVIAGPDLQAYIGDVVPHTDDNLVVEYHSARLLNRPLSEFVNLQGLVEARRPPGWGVNFGDGEAAKIREQKAALYFAATSYALDGHLALMWMRLKDLEGDQAGAQKAYQRAVQRFLTAQEKNPLDPEPDDYFHSFDLPDIDWVTMSDPEQGSAQPK